MKLNILIISYKSLTKLKNCLNNFNINRKVLIVENSNNFRIKKYIEKNYKNCSVIINGKNLGFGKACNIGLKNIDGQYVLILNTDVTISKIQIKKIENELNKIDKHFCIASPISEDLIDFMNNSYDSYLKKPNLNNINKKKFMRVEAVKGHSLIINLKKFKDRNIFDDNFFFFYEEIDLCRRMKMENKKIYVLNKIKIKHQSAGSINPKYKYIYGNFRNWNYYWSRFYYYKKHYGYLLSLIKHTRKLIKFFINMIIFYIFSDTEFRKNKYRFLGLLAAITGKKSSESDKIIKNISMS